MRAWMYIDMRVTALAYQQFFGLGQQVRGLACYYPGLVLVGHHGVLLPVWGFSVHWRCSNTSRDVLQSSVRFWDCFFALETYLTWFLERAIPSICYE
jgi:hypothetical protein